MKKIIIAILSAVMLASFLTGCGSEKPVEDAAPGKVITTEPESPKPTQETEETSETVVENDSEKIEAEEE